MTRAEGLGTAYATNTSAKLSFIASVINYVASYDSDKGITQTALLVERNRLDAGMSGNVAIVNTHGKGLYAGIKGIGPIDIGDRPHFRAALRNRGNRLTIGAPIFSRIRLKQAIPFARPVRHLDGTLVGVVSTAVDSATFSAGFGKKDIGRHGALSVIDLDTGIILSHYTVTGQAGSGLHASASFMQRVAASRQGLYWRKSRIDGVQRVFAYRKLEHFPIAILAGLALDDHTAETVAIRRNLLVASVAISLVILAALALWLRQIAAQQALNALNVRAEHPESKPLRRIDPKASFWRR